MAGGLNIHYMYMYWHVHVCTHIYKHTSKGWLHYPSNGFTTRLRLLVLFFQRSDMLFITGLFFIHWNICSRSVSSAVIYRALRGLNRKNISLSFHWKNVTSLWVSFEPKWNWPHPVSLCPWGQRGDCPLGFSPYIRRWRWVEGSYWHNTV